tara:strand:- start:546 stop:746 length:201 start_codon:yes stop_codon:yes gene_type:complete
MELESFKKLIVSHLNSKNVDAGIISSTVNKYAGSYQRGDYKGKATALITTAIKEAIKLQSKRKDKK